MKSTWFVLLLVVAAVLTGCKSKDPNSGAAPVDDLNPLGETDMYSMPLGERPLGGSEHDSPFEAVYFDYDSSQVRASERAKIEAVASQLRRNDGQTIVVEGHSDERGSNEYNMALGERRALAVRAYLIGLGIPADRIQTKSMGEEDPASMGHDEAAWSQNRRSEFKLLY